MNEQIEKMLRESLDVETPESADARILAAIRIGAAAHRRWRWMRWGVVAAGLALLLGGGLWQFSRQHEVALADECEIMLEIIDMAEPVDFAVFQVAQL